MVYVLPTDLPSSSVRMVDVGTRTKDISSLQNTPCGFGGATAGIKNTLSFTLSDLVENEDGIGFGRGKSGVGFTLRVAFIFSKNGRRLDKDERYLFTFPI